jgi:hypothetical protein
MRYRTKLQHAPEEEKEKNTTGNILETAGIGQVIASAFSIPPEEKIRPSSSGFSTEEKTSFARRPLTKLKIIFCPRRRG